jgi:hypothetical protein
METYILIPEAWAESMNGKQVDFIAQGGGIQVFTYRIANNGDYVTSANAYTYFSADFTALEATGWSYTTIDLDITDFPS